MSKVEVNQVTQQCGTTLTVGGGACKTAVVDATTVTIGRCGGTVSLASGATQSGFGRTGAVNWDTASIKTATFTAVSGNGYFCNTTAGAFNITLPASPSAKDIVALKDYAGTFPTYNLTIDRNGSLLDGNAANAVLDTQWLSLTLVYVDGTQGWVATEEGTGTTGPTYISASVTGACNSIVTSGDYKAAVFKGPGTFTVDCVASAAPSNIVDYLVVAGGGGGGWDTAGGGGAGGSRFYSTAPGCNGPLNNYPSGTAITVTATAYPIAVGAAGGAGGPGCSTGGPGAVSTFDTVTSTGGGGGGKCAQNGGSGGSGGGGARNAGTGGAASPVTSPVQGFAGGDGSGSNLAGAGGGGGGTTVGQYGGPDGTADRGWGGVGTYIADPFIGPTAPSYGEGGPVGSTRYFSGGAGGGVRATAPNSGADNQGGVGGGGDGGKPGVVGGTAGVINTGGGGGGGCGNGTGSGGGSGVVIIRYKFQ